MQYFRIQISEACRSHLGIVLFFLNISIMVVCHATGAMGLFVKQEASSHGNFLVLYNTSSLFKLLLCLSLLFLLFHLIGAKICYDSAFYETRERFHSVLFYWLLAGCSLVPLTVAAIMVLTAHQDMVVRGIGLGFRQAMKKYKIDTPMREYINRLQIEHQCCGATNITDWFRVSWVDTSNAAPVNRLANSHYMESNGEFLPRWAPFSCCRQDFIGAPCESVAMFFGPKKNEEWIKKSNIYSIDYLSEYDKYAAAFKRVSKELKKPPQDALRRGRAVVQSRRAVFDTFLREVTGHADLKPPSPPAGRHPPSADGRTETARALFEAHGVRAQSFPRTLFERLGGPPWRGRMVWSYDNISTAESDNLDQLLRRDGRDEDSSLALLRWRSFNQAGCAEPIGRAARLAMRAADFLFVFVLAAQILILILTRYLQTSIDTAYRWGNPLLSAPGFLFNTSQPPRLDDYETLMQEGEAVLGSLAEDLDEDDVTVLMSPSRVPGESDDTQDTSADTSAGLSDSSAAGGGPASEVGSAGELGSAADTDTSPGSTDSDGDGDGEDEGGAPGGPAAPVGGPRPAVRVSVRPAVSANRASAMRLQSVTNREEQLTADDDDEGVMEMGMDEEEGDDEDQQSVVKPNRNKSVTVRSTEKQPASSLMRVNSKLKKSSSTDITPQQPNRKKLNVKNFGPGNFSLDDNGHDRPGQQKLKPRNSEAKKSSPKKPSQDKRTSEKTSPKNGSSSSPSPKKDRPEYKTDPRKSNPQRNDTKKSSPKKSSPRKPSPKTASSKKPSLNKSSPKKLSPKKSSPKKTSPKKSSPKKSSPKKSSPKKASPKKSSPKKPSPKKSSPKKSKAKAAGKSANKSKQKAQGHKTKSKKSPKKGKK